MLLFQNSSWKLGKSEKAKAVRQVKLVISDKVKVLVWEI
jgi:hypothetical protein